MNGKTIVKQWALACLLLAGFACGTARDGQDGQTRLRVMTFNLWHGGDGVRWPLDTVVKYQLQAIRQAGADVVGIQEQTANLTGKEERARRLADSLGWHCHVIDGSRAIISRFPVRPVDSSVQAVRLMMPEGTEIVFGVMHLMYTPYEPYDIADGKLTTSEAAEASARTARLHQVEGMLAEINGHRDLPIVLVGDFNEPSCLDWTATAIRHRRNPALTFPVDWPATALLLAEGFKDAYRDVFPDVTRYPGYTWTSVEGLWRQPEIHDRIDLIYVSRDRFRVDGAWVVGEPSDLTDLVVEPWPSDHRAVVAELTVH